MSSQTISLARNLKRVKDFEVHPYDLKMEVFDKLVKNFTVIYIRFSTPNLVQKIWFTTT